jgi:hypothetical protein
MLAIPCVAQVEGHKVGNVVVAMIYDRLLKIRATRSGAVFEMNDN